MNHHILKQNPTTRVGFYFNGDLERITSLRFVHCDNRLCRPAFSRMPLSCSQTSFFRGSNPRYHILKQNPTTRVGFHFNGDLERIRTSDPQLRRLLLYPAELRDQSYYKNRRFSSCSLYNNS